MVSTTLLHPGFIRQSRKLISLDDLSLFSKRQEMKHQETKANLNLPTLFSFSLTYSVARQNLWPFVLQFSYEKRIMFDYKAELVKLQSRDELFSLKYCHILYVIFQNIIPTIQNPDNFLLHSCK